MNIPQALRSRMLSLAPVGGAIPPQHTIGVPIQKQLGNNWCWAAVAVSIRNFQTPTSPMQQCELAKIQLNHTDCCPPPAKTACDLQSALQIALANAGVAATNSSGAMTFPAVQLAISSNRPVCCAIRWTSNSYHFVAIDGYVTGGPRGDEVFVNDSLGPGGRMTYTTLVSNYQNVGGAWLWSYQVL